MTEEKEFVYLSLTLDEYGYTEVRHIYKIEKITSKLIFCGNRRFNKEDVNNVVSHNSILKLNSVTAYTHCFKEDIEKVLPQLRKLIDERYEERLALMNLFIEAKKLGKYRVEIY